MKSSIVFVVGVAVALCASIVPARWPGGVVLFDRTGKTCSIVVPRESIAVEWRAAVLLQRVLAQAAGRQPDNFPIISEPVTVNGPAIFVGATDKFRGEKLSASALALDDNAVGLVREHDAIALLGERRELALIAACWFLEKYAGVFWFIPGPLGEHIPQRRALVVGVARDQARPSFLSRTLSGLDDDDGGEWPDRSKLEARIHHGLCLDKVFTPEDFRRHPEMAPILAGRRYMPRTQTDYDWQPNLAHPLTIRHATDVILREFARSPDEKSFSLCVNDSFRFDESISSREAIGPLRYFRGRPDLSNYVFRFTNSVAREVRRHHPRRWIGAYAYYWAENAPDFPIEPNVVPYLTADRSQWFDSEFAEEDRALIARWCQSGAGIVGIYDYLEGAPYLVPRSTLFAVSEPVRFAFGAGVRAYYGESHTNWALDGPKPWLTAQLLWSAKANPRRLLDIYFRYFWSDAAQPMREFYGVCDRVWRTQPRPGYWLKYYADGDQARLFGADVRRQLRGLLSEARQRASTPECRARVDFVAAGFAVTESFAAFCEARDELSRRAERDGDESALWSDWTEWRTRRDEFERQLEAARANYPLAVRVRDGGTYMRNDPSVRVALRLIQSQSGRALLVEREEFLKRATGLTLPDVQGAINNGNERTLDREWNKLGLRDVRGEMALAWTDPASAWRGTGETAENRSIRLIANEIGFNSLHFEGVWRENLGLWSAIPDGGTCLASVRVRAKVSPGNETYLLMSFLDEKERYVGGVTIDRVPPGDWSEGITLAVAKVAPAQARFVGIGICVRRQVVDDFAEFSRPSLRVLPKK